MDEEVLIYYRNLSIIFSRSKIDDNKTPETALRERYEYFKQLPSDSFFDPEVYLSFAWAALGLMTYGKVDIIEDIIRNLPPSPESRLDDGLKQKQLTLFLIETLPLPNYINTISIRDEKAEVLEWFNEHKKYLVWDNDKKVFVLQEEDKTK